jgi:cell division transport system permease protein
MGRRAVGLKRVTESGIKNFFRNSWLTVAATAVMIVSLVIILSAVVLNVTARNAIKELSKNLKISIYLKDGATQKQISNLTTDIKSNNAVASVDYVSKADAQKQFNKTFQSDPNLISGLEILGTNTLPASLEVSVTDLSKINEVGAIPNAEKYKSAVESVTIGKTDVKKTIDRAASAQKFITLASVIAAIVFALVSMLIIFNTIRMAIFTRAEEIRIMKLIGATPTFIRGPFLIESSMYGIIAGLISSAIVVTGIFYLGMKISNQVEFAATYKYFTSVKVIIAMVCGAISVGILVGVISSLMAMKKHLRLKSW